MTGINFIYNFFFFLFSKLFSFLFLLFPTGPAIGESLVPYYRQLLPILNLFRNVNINIGDKIYFNPIGCVGDAVEQTLQLLEKYGGRDSFINIKYMVPTYESSI